MTAEQFVKGRFPKAIVEHYKLNDPFDKKGYYLCWSSYYKGDRLSEGSTKSQCWKNAKENIARDETNLYNT